MKNILDYFEKTAERFPEKQAVYDSRTGLTWRELKELSMKAGSAVAGATGTGRPVAVLASKSTEMLACMFGVLYAGCFYVVIDPSQPPERVRKILSVTETELVICEEGKEGLLEESGYSGRILSTCDACCGPADMKKLEQTRYSAGDGDPLYILFTSGSTGTPKGVTVSHRAVIDFITHFTDLFGLNEADRIGNQAPFDFDVSVKDIYSCVMTGAQLVIIPTKMFSVPGLLLDYLCDQKVTVLIWAVSALTLISSLRGLRYKVPADVRLILFSGEVMPVKQLLIWQKALPETEFVNLYGPTEITCNCTYYPIRKTCSEEEVIPVGRPFPGREIVLTGEDGRTVTEQGIPGEICVGGESLSDGYYNNPTATESVFFMLDPGDGVSRRYYRTGDIGYYGRDGELYFSGRKDFQFKHMGHRIEPEEIERAVDRTEGVERSCCIMDGKRNRLIVFYIGNASPEEIRSGMKKSVPSYMIPHAFIRTSNMPLNKNGKTDRHILMQRLEALH